MSRRLRSHALAGLLLTAVSIPQAFAEAATAIGSLREQVSSTLELVSSRPRA